LPTSPDFAFLGAAFPPAAPAYHDNRGHGDQEVEMRACSEATSLLPQRGAPSNTISAVAAGFFPCERQRGHGSPMFRPRPADSPAAGSGPFLAATRSRCRGSTDYPYCGAGESSDGPPLKARSVHQRNATMPPPNLPFRLASDRVGPVSPNVCPPCWRFLPVVGVF